MCLFLMVYVCARVYVLCGKSSPSDPGEIFWGMGGEGGGGEMSETCLGWELALHAPLLFLFYKL